MTVEREYRDIVETAVIAAAGIGVPGALSFGMDVAALSATWAIMIAAIADQSGHEMDKAFAVKLVASVLAGVGGYTAGSKIAVSLLNFIPGAGTLAAMGVNSVMNALYTYKMGHAISTMFDKDGFHKSDIEEMAGSLVAVVISAPSLGEIKDIVRMLKED